MKLTLKFFQPWKFAVLILMVIACNWMFFIPSASATTYEIKLGSDKGMLAFEPNKLTIKPGDTIKWVNNKIPPHNVVFDRVKNPAKSDQLAQELSHKKLLLSPGQSRTTTFPEDAPAGDYVFYCEPHRGAGMIGKITVAS